MGAKTTPSLFIYNYIYYCNLSWGETTLSSGWNDWGKNDLGAKQPQFAPNSAVLWSGDKSVIRDKIYLSTLDSPLIIVNTQPVIGLSSLEHHPGYSLCCWMTSWNYALIQSLIIFPVPPGYSKVKLILLSIWYHCTRRRANARNVKARLHRRFLLRSFSFWCMWLNGLTYECIRPSVQSYINQYFCDSTTQSHASEWEKSPQKSPV